MHRQVDSVKFSMHVDCDRGSVLLWNVFDMLCTSGFVDDVIFSYYESDGSVYACCVVFTMAGAKTRRGVTVSEYEMPLPCCHCV